MPEKQANRRYARRLADIEPFRVVAILQRATALAGVLGNHG